MIDYNQLKQLIKQLIYLDIVNTQSDFASKLGYERSTISGMTSGKKPVTESFANKVSSIFNVNIGWLTTGEGGMFNENNKISENPPSGAVIRFWNDIEATAGGSMAFGDDSTSGYTEMIMPNFRDCTDAITIYGDSMYPRYKSGQIVVLRPWQESYVEFGQAYLVVTRQDHRMVKYLFPAKDDSMLSCVSENKENYPAFEIDKEDIHKLFIVKGVIEQHLV